LIACDICKKQADGGMVELDNGDYEAGPWRWDVCKHHNQQIIELFNSTINQLKRDYS
jgi:hypothetical protein